MDEVQSFCCEGGMVIEKASCENINREVVFINNLTECKCQELAVLYVHLYLHQYECIIVLILDLIKVGGTIKPRLCNVSLFLWIAAQTLM